MYVKTCPQCNKTIPSSATVCPRCGGSIDEINEPGTHRAPEEPESPPSPSAEPSPTGSHGKILSIVSAAVIVLIVLVRLIYTAETLNTTTPQSDAKSESTSQTDSSRRSTMSPVMQKYIYSNKTTHEEIDPSDVFTSDNNYLTFYGMSELDGTQLVNWLQDAGYRSSNDDKGNPYWASKKNNTLVIIRDDESGNRTYLGPGDIGQFRQGAKGANSYFRETIAKGNYGSAYQILLDCSHIPQFAEKTEISSEHAAAWFVASNDEEYFARVSAVDAYYVLELYPPGSSNADAKGLYDYFVESKMEELIASLEEVEMPPTVTEECFDEHGWVTDYAFMELSGADLVQALKAKGYTFVLLDEYSKFKSLDGKCEISIKTSIDNSERNLSEEEIVQLGPNGGGEPVCCVISNKGYRSNQEAFESMQAATLLDFRGSAENRRKVFLDAVVSSDSASQELVDFYTPNEGTWMMWLYPEDTVSSGAFRKRLGEGSSIDEIWQRMTRGTIGEHITKYPVEWK